MDRNAGRVRFWRPTGAATVELTRCFGVRHSLPRHNHAEYEISLLESGAGTLRYRGQSLPAQLGQLRVLQSGEAHSVGAEGETGITLRVLSVAPEFLRSVSGEIAPRAHLPNFPQCDLRDADLCQRFLRLHRLLEHPASTLETETRLREFLQRLVSSHAEFRAVASKRDSESRAVAVVRDYVEAHFSQEISLDNLSHLAGLSPYRLNRAFRRIVGVPPHAFQTQQRIACARTLLYQGHPAANVARDVGFYDQSHLNRHFKRLVGVTCGEYAQRKNRARMSYLWQASSDTVQTAGCPTSV